MNIFISTFFLISLWITFSYSIFKSFEKNFFINRNFYLSISLGFIFLFTFLGSLNILLHLFGISFSNSYLLLPIIPPLIFINYSKIKDFYLLFYSDIKKVYKYFASEIDPFISIIILIIFIQIFCLFLRFLLPVTHTDALSQYFYDSLQISRLENLSISNYYQLGESLRTDSLASFFDALILQLTDNWFLVRTLRLIALILVIISSIEMASNIGSLSFKKSILLTSVILTLPDVWDIALSGKHDVYAFLFELIGIYTIALSIITKDKLIKITFLNYAIFIGFMSTGIRLSSITFLILTAIFFIFNIIFYPISLYFKDLFKSLLSIRILILFLLLGTLIANLTICFLNLKYFSNPFYKLSPPGSLEFLFPNAIYTLDYRIVKEALSLRNIPIFIKPIFTIIYSTFALEPIRFVLNKFKDFNALIFIIANNLNFIGPKAMMVSILSFSPFIFLPFFGLKNLFKQRKKYILIFITIWILFWSLSIPYTRVALASSISLVIFGFSEPFSFKFDFERNRYLSILKRIVFSFGCLYIVLFSIWSLSYLPDLPLNSLLNKNGYSRTNLTREYINLQNIILKKNIIKNIVPSKKFELNWKEIEKNNPDKLLFLKGVPKRFGYFMNRGLITSEKIKLSKGIEKKSICFELDKNQNISKNSC